MSTPENPFEHERRPPPKRPEFIVIDDKGERLEEGKPGFAAFEIYEESLKTPTNKFPVLIHIIFVLALLCALGWIIGTVVCTIIFSLLACITFFQVKQLNTYALKAWDFFKIALVGFISALIGLFSPSLGFGLFLLFFTLRPQDQGENFIQRLVKNYYNKL